jgi:ribosomal protein L34E
VFGHHKRPVGCCLDDWITDIGQIGNGAPVIQTISSRALRAALDDVPCDDTRRQLIPVRRAPPELVAKWRHRQRRVSRTAGDNYVGAFCEGLHDRLRADVRIGGKDPVTNRRQRLSGIHVGEQVSLTQQSVETTEQIVAGYDADANASGIVLLRNRFHRSRCRRGIHASCISDDLDALLDYRRENALHRTDKVARVSKRGISLLLLLQNRHRDFGQVVKHQVINLPSFHLPTRGVQIITPESLTAGDAHDTVQVLSPRCGGSTNGPRCGPGLWSVARRARLSISRVFSG